MVDGELWRAGNLLVRDVGGKHEQHQGLEGSLLAALGRSGRLWFALATASSGLGRRSSLAAVETVNLLWFLGWKSCMGVRGFI